MTQEERDELLIRLDERTKRIVEDMGNRESACEEVHTALDEEIKELKKSVGGWRTTAVALGAVLLTVAAQNAGPLVTFLRATIP